ncbi:MAG: PAS domain S-box protein [Terrimicrobiaceae bacterium]
MVQYFYERLRTAPWQERASRFGWKSAAAIPLHLRGKTIGALTIYDDASEVFGDDERRLFVEMEKTIGFALDHFANEDEHKRGEAALHESEERLRAITDSAQDGILMMDPEGRICFWNTAAERIFGYPGTEALGKNLHALIAPPGYHAAHHAAFPEFLKTGKGNAVGKTLDMEALCKDGSKISVQLSLSAIRIHGVWHGVGLIRDTTEQKRVDGELRRSEARFRKYFELPLHGRCITSPEKGWIEVNDRLCEILGYSREELLGRTWAEMTHPEDLAADVAQFERIVSGEIEQYKLEKRFIRKDGATVWTEISVGCVRNPDRTVDHFLCVMEDISERKAMEGRLKDALHRAEAGSRTKSEFLAIMSHELRTPLNGVLGYAQLLSDTRLDPEQQAYTEMISNSGEHLLAIVSDILDFSSIEAGTLALHVAPLAVANLVKTAEDTVRKSAAEKGLELRFELAAGVPEQFTGDEQRLRQVLINLLGNAVKFTSAGAVVLRVARSGQVASRPFSLEAECPPTTSEGSFLDFSVEDTGIGISSEELGRLFQPFVQADSKKNRQFGGTGLGLAISRRIAEAMSGTITVASTPGKGSTFTFRFPLEPVCAGGMAQSPISDREKSALTEPRPSVQIGKTPMPLGGGLVLVVEDDRGSRMLAGKMLEALGLLPEFAADGEGALQAFVPGKYFAILMDMSMPVMDGLEATKKIREVEAAAGSHVPIIALTANVMTGDRERCLAAGMDDFLSKPFKKDELAAKLANFANR